MVVGMRGGFKGKYDGIGANLLCETTNDVCLSLEVSSLVEHQTVFFIARTKRDIKVNLGLLKVVT
jgi:hypothetical protein